MYTQKINYGMTEEYFGLSTDTKPAQADNGDLLTEMDTGKKFRFDEQNGVWYEQPAESGSSSGGGSDSSGSGDFVATITSTATSTQGDTEISCDKTFEEIVDADSSGKRVLIRIHYEVADGVDIEGPIPPDTEKEVWLITDGSTYGGSRAVAFKPTMTCYADGTSRAYVTHSNVNIMIFEADTIRFGMAEFFGTEIPVG